MSTSQARTRETTGTNLSVPSSCDAQSHTTVELDPCEENPPAMQRRFISSKLIETGQGAEAACIAKEKAKDKDFKSEKKLLNEKDCDLLAESPPISSLSGAASMTGPEQLEKQIELYLDPKLTEEGRFDRAKKLEMTVSSWMKHATERLNRSVRRVKKLRSTISKITTEREADFTRMDRLKQEMNMDRREVETLLRQKNAMVSTQLEELKNIEVVLRSNNEVLRVQLEQKEDNAAVKIEHLQNRISILESNEIHLRKSLRGANGRLEERQLSFKAFMGDSKSKAGKAEKRAEDAEETARIADERADKAVSDATTAVENIRRMEAKAEDVPKTNFDALGSSSNQLQEKDNEELDMNDADSSESDEGLCGENDQGRGESGSEKRESEALPDESCNAWRVGSSLAVVTVGVGLFIGFMAPALLWRRK